MINNLSNAIFTLGTRVSNPLKNFLLLLLLLFFFWKSSKKFAKNNNKNKKNKKNKKIRSGSVTLLARSDNFQFSLALKHEMLQRYIFMKFRMFCMLRSCLRMLFVLLLLLHLLEKVIFSFIECSFTYKML